MKTLQNFINLFGDDYELNESVDLSLVTLAEKVTNCLKDANDTAKKNILKHGQNV